MTITVQESHDSGYSTYIFTSRGTFYEVLTNDNVTYSVWSERISASFGPKLTVYDSLAEMGKRCKALADLATLIEA